MTGQDRPGTVRCGKGEPAAEDAALLRQTPDVAGRARRVVAGVVRDGFPPPSGDDEP